MPQRTVPTSFPELVPNPESRKAFSAVERRKIEYLLAKGGAGRRIVRNLTRYAAAVAALIVAGLFFPDYMVAMIGAQAIWWAVVLLVGPAVYFVLQVPFARRDYAEMRGYLQRTVSVAESAFLLQVLRTAKRFLWLIVVLLPMTCLSLVALVHSLGLIVLPNAAETAWIGKAFIAPWTIAVALCLVSVTALFESTINAGILLKVHLIRTGERKIHLKRYEAT